MMIRGRIRKELFGQDSVPYESFEDVRAITVSTGYIGPGTITLWFSDGTTKAYSSDSVRGIMTIGKELTVLEAFHADFVGEDDSGDTGYRLTFKTPIRVDYNSEDALLILKK